MTNTTTAAPYPQTFNTFRAVGALRSFRPGIDMDGGDLEPPRHLQREPRDVVAAGRLHRGRQQRRQACCRPRGDAAPLGFPPGADPPWHIGAVGGGHIIRALTAHRLVLKGVARRLWRGAQRDHGMPVRSMTASVGRPLPVIPSLPPLRQASPSGHSGRHG